MSEYIRFYEVVPSGRKTRIVKVFGLKNDVLLGEIKFWGAWRQYTFQPESSTVFDIKCLNEITAKLDDMNTEIRETWKRR